MPRGSPAPFLALAIGFLLGGCSAPSEDEEAAPTPVGSEGSGPSPSTLAPGEGWPEGFNVFIYGSPPQDFVSAVRGSILGWSVYGTGVSEGERAYVDLMRSLGMKVMANLITMQGISTGDQDLAARVACKTLYGKPARAFWIQPNPPYLMCNNNPELRSFLEARTRDQVDGMADGVHIDEIEGIGGHLYIAGFCDFCMAGFRSYLASRFTPSELASRFGIEDVSAFSYRDYLIAHWAKGPWNDPNPDFRREFVRFEMVSRKAQIEDLIAGTRAYAGREIKFSGNTFYLSPNKHLFVKDLDFLVFENRLLMPPRGKNLGTYSLVEALGGDRDAVMFPDILVLALIGTDDYAVVRHWIAEAYSTGGSFLLPKDAYTFGGGHLPLPAEEVAPVTDFLYARREIYSGSLAVARVGLIYDYATAFGQYVDQWYRMPWFAGEPFHVAYMGAAAALQEAHIPFRTVYAGDGDLVDEPLTDAKVASYDVLILPYAGVLDEAGESVLARYERRGGKVLRIYDMTNGYWFLRGAAVREKLARMVEEVSSRARVETSGSESLSIIPRISGTFDIHLLNYDYDSGAHAFRDAANVSVRLPVPDGVSLAGKDLVLAAPGEADTTISFDLEGGRVSFTVPKVANYAVASFR